MKTKILCHVLLLCLFSPFLSPPAYCAPNRYVEIEITGPVNEKRALYEFLFPRFRTMNQYLDLFDKARDDPEVGGLILRILDPEIGWAKTQQLRRAVREFRKSGKKVHALLTGESLTGYLLACACDEVTLSPSSPLMLTGLRMEVYFFKDLLLKLGIEADVVAIGRYKTAADSLTRESMSDEMRVMLNSILDEYYLDLVSSLVEDRKLTTDTALLILDQGPFSSREALKLKLVDRVGYEEDLYQYIEQGLPRYLNVVRDYDRPAPLAPQFNIFKFLFPQQGELPKEAPRDKIALIVASGMIVPGKRVDYPFQEDIIAADDLIEQINECRDKSDIVAIVLRIDSPGGSALASDLIWHTVMKAREKKPVVSSLSDVAASGGYYIAMAANKIISEPGTLTGSIGVITGKPVFMGLMEKIGVNVEVLSRGGNSGIFSPARQFSPSERAIVEKLSSAVYDDFVDKIARSRNMTRESVLRAAEGRVWTGRQAFSCHLVDDLGGLEKAVLTAKELAGIPATRDIGIQIYPLQLGLFDFIREMFSGGEFASMSLPPSHQAAWFLVPVPMLKSLLPLVQMFKVEPTLAVMPLVLEIR